MEIPMTAGTLTGKLPAELANSVSQALAAAIGRGATADEACCVAAQVVADYWRCAYGNEALQTLCQVVLKRAEVPLPAGIAGVPKAESPAASDADGKAEIRSTI
ncbi:MAG: hypothetical protein JSR21_10110 [Proteobacteria bacterium]|nr:hypothetical protein [Pseudomonadota bacterium]